MSSSIRSVLVDLATRSYSIQIGQELLPQTGKCLRDLRPVSHAVVITDEHVNPHARQVAESVQAVGARVDLFSVAAGETSKSVEQAARLWNQLRDCGTDRKSVVVAVGGGVVGDLAGYVAASFARGLDFVQVPTTLLADVDSSVGGKVGINLDGAKNMVGHFWQPLHVLIDTGALDTLPDREFRSGLAEVVKYGVILDAEFLEFLEENCQQIMAREPSALSHVISRSCQLKADVVEQDETETTGLRAILNYGHTFAHAFEATMGYGELLHGEAVSIGMLCASRLAELMGRIDSEATHRQRKLLEAFSLPTKVPPVECDQLLSAMQRDKKVEHGKLRFILPTKIGHVELVPNVDSSKVLAALRDA